ncbi:helix-turn-helix domain-containing protein [Halalkalibacter kiskunsagensis]|uniref:Helix-turn-helix domain-containing protein n=1 Tax=Halalkalibacter kiskunsagensis TaxID=1548599 RepID=A0ABV6K9V3_9BACI
MNVENIRINRLNKWLTLTELALASGVSKSYISYIKRGAQQKPDIVILQKISKALDVELVQLIAGSI